MPSILAYPGLCYQLDFGNPPPIRDIQNFLYTYRHVVTLYIAINVWKIMSCREPEGLGYATYACPDHPGETCHIPRTCKSCFCSVCAKV